MVRNALNKTELARELGISRSSLYYQPKRVGIDEEVKRQIESVLTDHPAYGHKRVALELKLNKKRILRVMKKFGIKPYRRKRKPPDKKRDRDKPSSGYPNLIEDLNMEKPDFVWATDFTYIKYRGKFIYLATVIDLYTREVLGVNISRFHNRFLVMGALLKALENQRPPEIIHSDQGSEYDSKDFTDLAENYQIKISMSRKASPWENGYQESFFGHLKGEAGDFSRFETLGELVEEIYHLVYYYNNQRIHSSLKMQPFKFRQRFNNLKIKSESQ